MNGLNITKQKIAVIGFGVSGTSVARYFLAQGVAVDVFEDKKESYFDQNLLASFTSTDSFRIFFSDSVYSLDINAYDYVIASPGVHTDHPVILRAEEVGIEYITDINTFLRIFKVQYPNGKVISVTGSNGKSTTVSLMYEVLKAAGLDVYLGGNIGTSPLDFFGHIKTDAPYIILETSSYQLEYMKEQDYFDIACILNLSDNHLDRYHGKKELYAKAKLQGIKKDYTHTLVNFDDDYTKKYILPQLVCDQVLGIEFEHVETRGVITLEDNSIIFSESENKITYVPNIKQLGIKGLHNIYNSAFVCGVLHVLEVLPTEAIAQAFYGFKGLMHRIQLVETIEGITYINDSKSTSPDATIKALEAVGNSKNIVLISGGEDKDIEYGSMLSLWGEHVKSVVLLPGSADKKLKKLTVDSGVDLLGEVQTMEEAVASATKAASPGDVVLLSPSTASFASFKSFEDMGNQFIACVQKLKR
jgi:UDP-N-acetylmuramoylalanine--D-glutamate ligase